MFVAPGVDLVEGMTALGALPERDGVRHRVVAHAMPLGDGALGERPRPAPRELPADGPVRLLCIAGLQAKKGHRVLLDALRSPLPGFERLELDLVGDGPLRERPAPDT